MESRSWVSDWAAQVFTHKMPQNVDSNYHEEKTKETCQYRRTYLTNRFAAVKNEMKAENAWKRRTERKLAPGEKGDEDNQVCLY